MPESQSPTQSEAWLTELMKDNRLKGWRLYPEMRMVLSEIADKTKLWATKSSISVEIRSVRDFGWGEHINRRDLRDIEFSEIWDGEEVGVYSARFAKVRDPDLSDLDHLRMFLADRLDDMSPHNWEDALRGLREEADRDFLARKEAFERCANKPIPSTSREDRAARASEFKAWQEQQDRAVLAAFEASHERLTIAGSRAGYIWDSAIEVFATDKFDQSIFDKIPDEWVRDAIDNYIQRKLKVAYRLGRWIREAEIVEDHGSAVEVGAVAKRGYKKGGKKTGQLMISATDSAWRLAAKTVWSRLETEQPGWGATKVAKQIQAEVTGASKLELSTVKSAVEKWRREAKSEST